jgi:ankyrin repeat protein
MMILYSYYNIHPFIMASGNLSKEELNGILKSLITRNLDDIQVAEQIINFGADPNTISEDGETILFLVVRLPENFELSTLKKFVKLGCDVNKKNKSGLKPIDIAIENKYINYIDFFLTNGVDPNERIPEKNNSTRLHSLCEGGNINHQVMLIFINNGASLLIKNDPGKTPLDLLLDANGDAGNYFKQKAEQQKENYNNELKDFIGVSNQFDRAERLIKLGADPNTFSRGGAGILHSVVFSVGTVELIEKFVKLGCDVNIENQVGWKPIDYAIQGSKFEALEWFLRNGIDVNERTSYKYNMPHKLNGTRMHLICNSSIGRPDDARKLLDIYIKNGGNLLLKDNDNKIPLDIAKNNLSPGWKNDKVIERLEDETKKQKEDYNNELKNNFNVNISFDRVEQLIKHGADPNTVSQTGETVLYWIMTFSNSVELIEKFVKLGCDINIGNLNGLKAIDYAISETRFEILEWFLKNGIDANERLPDKNNSTRMHLICSASICSPYFVRKLLDIYIENGANLLLKDNDNKIPLDIAEYCLATLHEIPRISWINGNVIEKLEDETKKQQEQCNEKLRKCIVSRRSEECIEEAVNLIKNGADPNTQNVCRHTILFTIAMFGSCDQILEFINLGCDVHAKDARGWKAIDYCIKHGAFDEIDLFLKNGIDPNERQEINNNNTRLHLILNNGFHKHPDDHLEKWYNNNSHQNPENTSKLIDVFVKNGANLLLKNNAGQIPLDVAKICKLGDEAKVKEETDKQLKKLEDEMKSFINSDQNDIDEVKINRIIELINYGVDPNIRGQFGRTILMRCSKHGTPGMIQKLINVGCDIHCKNTVQGHEVIDYAIHHDNFELVRWYLQNGIDPNENIETAKDAFKSRLHGLCRDGLQAQNNIVKIVKIFVENGADLFAVRKPSYDQGDGTPLDTVKMNADSLIRKELVQYLQEKVDEQRNTLLQTKPAIIDEQHNTLARTKPIAVNEQEDDEKVTKVVEFLEQEIAIPKDNKEKHTKELTIPIDKVKLFESVYANGYTLLNKMIKHIDGLNLMIYKQNYISHIRQNMREYMTKLNSEDAEKLKELLEKLYKEIIKWVHAYDNLNAILMDLLIMVQNKITLILLD